MRDQPPMKDHCCSNMALHFYTFIPLIKDHLLCKTLFGVPLVVSHHRFHCTDFYWIINQPPQSSLVLLWLTLNYYIHILHFMFLNIVFYQQNNILIYDTKSSSDHPQCCNLCIGTYTSKLILALFKSTYMLKEFHYSLYICQSVNVHQSSSSWQSSRVTCNYISTNV